MRAGAVDVDHRCDRVYVPPDVLGKPTSVGGRHPLDNRRAL
jgi:hypothetical protein